MIKISGLRLRPDEPESHLAAKVKKELGAEVRGFQVLRRSIDARKKSEVAFVYTIGIEMEPAQEQKLLKKCRSKKVTAYQPEPYAFPVRRLRLATRPVIIGTGPAGLFCGLMLARIGARPILLERGQDVDTRTADVSAFWAGGPLKPASNVQFGEGGAGTFSDGKLNTGVNDARMQFILQEFVSHGAPKEILCEAAPHVGTDYLRSTVRAIREELLSLGAEVRFGHQVTELLLSGGAVSGVLVDDGHMQYTIETERVVLAIGHSARDTFEMLYRLGVPVEQKQFAMGVRIEHLQKDISASQYGIAAESLPAANYRLSCHPTEDRGAFSFCVCPGGLVVAAASEEGGVCTNGMSNHARDEVNINGGLLVSVRTADFGSEHPLAGMYLQRELEQKAFLAGGGNYNAPCQRVEDFLQHRPSAGPGRIQPSYRPGVRWCDLHECLPRFITDTLEQAIPALGRKLHGFDDPDAVLTAIEARSSSPIRIPRDDSGQSVIRGLYPCGEGAGYAGGIMSAAADGIRTAEKICSNLMPESE